MQLYCYKCGNSLSSDHPFCPLCGTSQKGNDHSPTRLSQQEDDVGRTGKLSPGHVLQQRYRLLHTIGKGGMGVVYLAQDTQSNDHFVAVKEMSISQLTEQELPQAIEQFRREAQLLASLKHPNLPRIYEHFYEDDRWYLVMSFIEGPNLEVVLNTAPGKKLPTNDAVRIAIKLCEILYYLHTHQPQVIFRDLKPSNIILTPEGHVCLIDFGIARHFKQEQTKDTKHFISKGYSPLEQYGHSQTGPRSDIYSLGATLHEMLSGQSPANKPFQFTHLQLIDPTVPVPLARLVEQMLEMNELARPTSIAEVKTRLEQVLTPEHSVPTLDVSTRPKMEEQEKQATSLAPTQPPSTSSSLWSGSDAFFQKMHIIAWISFIVLSLFVCEVWPQLTIIHTFLNQSYRNFFFMETNFYYLGNIIISPLLFYGVNSGAAIIGLIFFLSKKRRPFIDIFGGLALSILALGEIPFFYPIFASAAFMYYDYPATYYSPSFNQNVALVLPLDFVDNPFFLIVSLWLFVGTCFFFRSANTLGRLLFGVFLITWGVGIYIRSWYFSNFYSVINMSSLIWNQNILQFLSILAALVGILAISVAVFIKQRNDKVVEAKNNPHYPY